MGRGLNAKPGDKIGKVTIVSREGSAKRGQHMVATWNVKCDCGKEWVAKSPAVTRAKKIDHWQCRSCSNGMRDYGMKNHYLYGTWYGMIQRCYNKTATCYANYGGRGIGVHHEWLADPSLFGKWCDDVLGPRPEGHTLDRIDNDKGYVKGNVRFVSVIFNFARNNFSDQDVLNFCQATMSHLN